VTTGAEVVARESLINVTVAPGITPPCVSLTVPLTVPVTPCAAADAATTRTATLTARAHRSTWRKNI
jgi:hypothetical protein